MAKATVGVVQTVEIQYNDDAFSPEFMEEFRKSFYPFHTVERHLEHLAILFTSGAVFGRDPFVEGYGPLSHMGITFDVKSVQTEIYEDD